MCIRERRARAFTATTEKESSFGGVGGATGKAVLTELTVLGPPVGNWTAQWALRMGLLTLWHDANSMPLVLTTVDAGAPIARFEASCLLPVRLALRSEQGSLTQDVTFRAGVVRNANLDEAGAATTYSWSYGANSATTNCVGF